MKSKIKTLALILIGATTAFTVSSCLGDSTDNYEERNAFVNKAMTSSLGNWSGKLNFSNTLKVKEEEPAVTWNTSKDKDSYKITISNFPVNKLAKSIKVPEVTATSSNELKLNCFKRRTCSFTKRNLHSSGRNSLGICKRSFMVLYAYAEY